MILRLHLAKHNFPLILVHKKFKSPNEYCNEKVYGHLAIVNDSDGIPIDLNNGCEEDNMSNTDEDEDENPNHDTGEGPSDLHDLSK